MLKGETEVENLHGDDQLSASGGLGDIPEFF